MVEVIYYFSTNRGKGSWRRRRNGRQGDQIGRDNLNPPSKCQSLSFYSPIIKQEK